MTREKAIKEYVIPALKHTWNEKINKEVLEALEQEPVLDKIKAEIIEKYWDCNICKWKIDYKPHYAIRGDINDILQILDKYKTESEPQESEDT